MQILNHFLKTSLKISFIDIILICNLQIGYTTVNWVIFAHSPHHPFIRFNRRKDISRLLSETYYSQIHHFKHVETPTVFNYIFHLYVELNTNQKQTIIFLLCIIILVFTLGLCIT